MEFEWDERKARDNLAKHGVSFDLATRVFDDPQLVLAADAAHSRRSLAISRSGKWAVES